MVELNKEVLEIWKHWIIERNRIYKRKEVDKLPPPWTEDSILKEFKFTNVKRWQDRESVWLINNIINNDSLSYEDKIYNCILFRTWNKSKTFEIVCGKGITQKDLVETPIEVFRSRIEKYATNYPGYVWFTNAFNTGGVKVAWKYRGKPYKRNEIEYDDPESSIPLRVIFMIKDCIKKDFVGQIKKAETAKEVFETLSKIRGCANFLAYQIYVDLTYIKEFPFSEDEFTVAGPGCIRGLNFLFKEKDGMKYEQLLFYLRDHQKDFFGDSFEDEFSYLPEEHRKLTVMDLENSFCELSKYYKVHTGIGRPRNKYHYSSL